MTATTPTADAEAAHLLDRLRDQTSAIEKLQGEVAQLGIDRKATVEALLKRGVTFPQMARHCGRSKSAFRYVVGRK